MRRHELNDLPLPELFAHLARAGRLERLLAHVREEDLGPEGLDLTSHLVIGERETMRAVLRSREAGVVSGLAAAPHLVRAFDAAVRVETLVQDGRRIAAGQDTLRLEGLARDVLAIERPLLNLVGRLSGVATRAARFVEAAGEGGEARVFDTRKTTPGLRHLEKYAVRCGGGYCHRMGLHDAILIKDNHLACLDTGSWPERVQRVVDRARAEFPGRYSFIEVEVDDLAQFDDLLSLPEGSIDFVLLDNMSESDMESAVRQKRERQPGLQLEASGGVTLETIGRVASTGVERISVGSLTHHAVSLDLGLDAE